MDSARRSPRRSFNPRPRTGGDHFLDVTGFLFLVSIHAPARGATSLSGDAERLTGVSIHAPARGATDGQCPPLAAAQFQSTPPHGGRPLPGRDRFSLSCFNPRPRTGGDNLLGNGITRILGFNPRPRTGGDHILPLSMSIAIMFQSTPPHGGRPGPVVGHVLHPRFQSTPPHGGRQYICNYLHPLC